MSHLLSNWYGATNILICTVTFFFTLYKEGVGECVTEPSPFEKFIIILKNFCGYIVGILNSIDV